MRKDGFADSPYSKLNALPPRFMSLILVFRCQPSTAGKCVVQLLPNYVSEVKTDLLAWPGMCILSDPPRWEAITSELLLKLSFVLLVLEYSLHINVWLNQHPVPCSVIAQGAHWIVGMNWRLSVSSKVFRCSNDCKPSRKGSVPFVLYNECLLVHTYGSAHI